MLGMWCGSNNVRDGPSARMTQTRDDDDDDDERREQRQPQQPHGTGRDGKRANSRAIVHENRNENIGMAYNPGGCSC